MKQKRYSLSMFWNTRSMDLKTKQSSISLTVNLPRQQFRISLKLTATKVDFDKAISTARILTAEQKELRSVMNEYIDKAEAIFSRLKEPTKESFTRLFKSESDLSMSNKTDVIPFFNIKRDEADKEGRTGTAANFKGCLRALLEYCPSPYFEDMDAKFLKGYQAFMKNKGNSDGTISIRMVYLRTICNYAQKEGFISEATNPYKEFSMPKSAASKDVLYPKQLKAFYEYKTVGTLEKKAKDIFFFLYMANGMNFKDMVYLKWKDISGDTFEFIREKTKLTSKSGTKKIRVHLHNELKRIIADMGNHAGKLDDYIFPILTKKMTLKQQHVRRLRYRRYINKKLGIIGKKLGFDVHLCTNLARHSFATMLKLNGTPVSFISDAMGHKNSSTTEVYLKSIPDENIKEMSVQLLSFG